MRLSPRSSNLRRRDVVSHGSSARPSKTSSAIGNACENNGSRTASAPCLGSPSERRSRIFFLFNGRARLCLRPTKCANCPPRQTAGQIVCKSCRSASSRQTTPAHAAARSFSSLLIDRGILSTVAGPNSPRDKVLRTAEVIRRATPGQDQAADAGVLPCSSAFVVRSDI